MWFQRKQSESDTLDYLLLPESHPGTFEHLVSEGVLLSEYAGRMALKNHIVVGVLTQPEPFDPKRYCEPAQRVIADLIRTAEASASLAVEQREASADRQGASQHEHDYRLRDAENLRRREQVNLAVAAQLAEISDNPGYLDAFVERARQDAWADIGTAIIARLDQQWPSPPGSSDDGLQGYSQRDTERSRRKALRQLRKDLDKMMREPSCSLAD
ncbi:MAG TPA: hypothetical protein VEX37_15475 [Thermomicrobiales bacterium]|nr:hypothetical protein [Thermomicrobiales bacterium]